MPTSITIPYPDQDILWLKGGHEVFTDALKNDDNYNDWDVAKKNAFKESVLPAAVEFEKGKKFGEDVKTARDTLKQELNDAADDDAKKVAAYEKHDKALKDANGTLFTGGGSKRGGSKKRRGKSKRRGSKRRGSKRRKY